MLKISSIIKNKKVILIVIIIFLLVFTALWNVVSGGYDRQNKAIIFLKKFIPSKVSRKARDIEYDKENNEFFLMFETTPSIGVLKLKREQAKL